MSRPLPDSVVVHPLVLLSVVDHYNRVAKDTKRRIVGVVLGESSKGRVDATNCYAVPFEEDDKDPSIWFLDHSYMENMFRMFKKVNAREKIIGWYHTGPRLRGSDMLIHDLVSNYCESNPVLIICEVQPKEMGLPVHAYAALDEIREDGTQKAQKVFVNLPTEVGATEAEEIGVEHLLRDVKDVTTSTLSSEVGDLVVGLKGLRARLKELETYLSYVLEGGLPLNHDVMRNLQDIFNLLPNLNVAQLSNSLAVESNDMMMVVYLASLVRSVIALHALIDNREERKAREMETAAKEKEKEKEREKEKEEKGKDSDGAGVPMETSNQKKDSDPPMD